MIRSNLLLEFSLNIAPVWGPKEKLLCTLLTSYTHSLNRHGLGFQPPLSSCGEGESRLFSAICLHSLGCERLPLPSRILRHRWSLGQPLGGSKHSTLLPRPEELLKPSPGSPTPIPVCSFSPRLSCLSCQRKAPGEYSIDSPNHI